MKVETKKQVFIALSEEEAAQLRAVMSFFARGTVPITDAIFDALDGVGIETDPQTGLAVEKHMEERYL